MPATITEARDQMCGLFKAAVSTVTGFQTLWDDVSARPDPADVVKPWARFKVIHTTGKQSALAGSTGRRRFTRGGFLVIQLFAVGGAGLVSTDEILPIILGAYEGKTTSGGIVFRNCRHQEIGADGPWHQTNVYVDFEYDDIK